MSLPEPVFKKPDTSEDNDDSFIGGS